MRFSDRYIKNLTPDKKVYDVQEPGGFMVRVQPTGSRTFYYRYTLNGKQKRHKIGPYPAMSLKAAREEYNRLHEARQRGESLEEKEIHTFESFYALYFDMRASKHKDGGAEDRRVVEKDVLPKIGHLDINKVTRQDIHRILDAVIKRGAERQTNIILQKLNTIFNYALDRGVVASSPAHRIQKPGKENIGERTLTAKEILRFWWGIEAGRQCDLVARQGSIRQLRLVLLTGQRPGEVAGMDYSEIDGHWWTIPAGRMKNGQEHRVYLCQTAKALVGEGSGVVFPGRNGEPSTSKSLNYSLRRLLLPTKAGVVRLPMDHFTPHDLRRTCSTWLASLGFGEVEIDRFISHVPPKLTRTYNKFKYDPQKKEMALAWEEMLLKIIKRDAPKVGGGGDQGGKGLNRVIVPLNPTVINL